MILALLDGCAMSDNRGMSTAATNLQKFADQTKLALAAAEKIKTALERKRLLHGLEQALWKFAMPYWAILYIVERTVDSGEFDRERFRALYDRSLPLERMVDDALAVARTQDYFNRPVTAAPLLALQACNERMKDCMVALESTRDQHLDEIMAAALDEHRRGETVPLD